jgi:hypothetical protein
MDDIEIGLTAVSISLLILLIWYICKCQRTTKIYVNSLSRPEISTPEISTPEPKADNDPIDFSINGFPFQPRSVSHGIMPGKTNNYVKFPNSMTQLRKLMSEETVIPFGSDAEPKPGTGHSNYISSRNRSRSTNTTKDMFTNNVTSDRQKQIRSRELTSHNSSY